MVMDETWYSDWYWNKATEDEKYLVDRVWDFEPFFEDMLFNPGTISYDLIKCQSKCMDSDDWIDDEVPRPDQLEYFSYSFFHFQVEELSDCNGYFNSKIAVKAFPYLFIRVTIQLKRKNRRFV